MRTILRRAAFGIYSIPVVAILAGPALAQRPVSLNTALAGFASPDPNVRERALSELTALTSPTAGILPWRVRALMAQNPDQAERIKTALIGALDTDAVYVRSLEGGRQLMTEGFSDYWSNLMWIVATFRDPRAVNGLLAGVSTGGIAVNGLADLCPSSVDALIAGLARLDVSSGRRTSALSALGECMKRVNAMEPSGQAAAKVREAAMKATNDADPRVREAAANVLLYFRSDPAVRAQLTHLAVTDPYQEGAESFRTRPGQRVVREAAASVLAAPNTDDDYYFVMRTPGTRACAVGKGSERPRADRYIGPEAASGSSLHMLCTHLDTTRTDRDLCWEVEPANACR